MALIDSLFSVGCNRKSHRDLLHFWGTLCALLGVLVIALIFSGLFSRSAAAQDALQAGEAFVTRFSGTTDQDGSTVIDTAGTVGAVVDLRQPGAAPNGSHWTNEPQRSLVTAAQVGQVFGVAMDDASPPNIYLTATAAFGLHRNADNSDWMSGQWGPEGGPGTVWKLSADNNYQPEVFAQIALEGRANSGAALGNIAFDPTNQQLYVSDLETGMIHRISVSDGQDLGTFDHGMTGRVAFYDVANQEFEVLTGVAFDSTSSAQTSDCADGDFAQTPACWNLADFRRRVWGLGVRRDSLGGEVRLYYATWSAQGFGHADFDGADDDDKRNALWSVAITEEGDFDTGSVRREFFLPDFFRAPDDITRAGRSHPVSDIAFPAFGDQEVMLVAERGGMRNQGLGADNAFTNPNEARVLRYELTDLGTWRGAGRYDVGYNDREEEGQPYIRAGAAGGVAFGTGYDADGELDPAAVDNFVWMSGDGLCSPNGPCFDSTANDHSDSSEVHGLQGRAEQPFEAFEPANAYNAYPTPGPISPPAGPDASYMIDIDANGDSASNDAGLTGDVEVYQQDAPEGAEPEIADFVPPGFAPPFPEGLPPQGWIPAPPPPGGGWFPPPPFPLSTDLAIAKAGPAQCQEGVNCAYTITITNVGPDPYLGPLAIADTMPPGASLAAATAGWNCADLGGTVRCVTNAPAVLAPGGTAAITLTILLPASIPAGTVQNCVAIDWVEMGTDDGPGDGNDEACVDTPVIAGFDMGIAKTGPVNCYENYECVFVIAVTNHGPGAFNGVVAISDTLPAGTTYVNSFPLGAGGLSCSPAAGNQINCVTPSIAFPALAVEAAVVVIRLPPGNVGGTYQNCALIDWATMGANDGAADAQPDNDCHTVTVLSGAGFHDLEVKKRGPASCNAGGNCTYEITVTNHGPDAYTGGLLIQDYGLPAGTTYAANTPPFVCLPGPLPINCAVPGPPHTLAPLASHTFTLTVALPAAPPDPFTNCVRFLWGVPTMPADDNPPPGGFERDDNFCTSTNVGAGFDLTIAKTAVTPDCYEGGLCDFTVDITNNGPNPATGMISFTDPLPPGATLEGTTGAFDCNSAAPGTVTCSYLGIAVGATSTATLHIRLPDPVAGNTVTNCASIDWSAPPPVWYVGPSYTGDDNPANDAGPAACATVNVLAADLRPFGATVCQLGSSCPLDVKVENSGGKLFKGAAGLRGELDPPVTISSIKSLTRGFKCRVTGKGTYECESAELTLKPRDAAKLKLVAEIPADFPHRRIIHRKEMLWPDPKVKDKKPENDRHVSTIWIPQPDEEREITPTPEPEPDFDLLVKKTGPASCSPGGLCEYTVTIVNEGPGTYRGGLYLFDTYPGYIESTFVSASGAGWNCFDDHGTVECRHDVVELGPRESVTIQITIRLSETIEDDMETRAGGGARNCARIDWPGENMRDERHRNFWIERVLVQEGLLGEDQVNGVLAGAERGAIRRYQAAHGLKPTGVADARTWDSMFPHSGRLEGDANADNDNRCIVTPLTPEIPPATMSLGPVPGADLKVTKTANQPRCEAGQPCSFGVAISNDGGAAYVGQLRVSDIIVPANARLTATVPRPWNCRGSRGKYSCTYPSVTLQPGELRAMTLTFVTPRQASGRIENCAQLDWTGPGLERSRVYNVQTALNTLGISVGKADGKAGAQTRKAIRDYQKRAGMRVTGRIDDVLMRRLFGSWGRGDQNAANDRACATSVIQAPEAPPPVCDAGWRKVGRTEAKSLAAKGWQVRQERSGPRSIMCAKPPKEPAPTCPSGWQQVSRDRAKVLVKQRWQIRQVGKIMCARPPKEPAPTCPSGWQQVSRDRAKALVQQRWQIRQVGNIMCAKPPAAPAPTCPKGWEKVSRDRAKVLVQQRWQIRQVGNIMCAKPPAAPAPTCPKGWEQVNRDRAKALVQQRWQIRQVGNIMCAKPPAAPAPTCPSGWTLTNRDRAKTLVRQGWEIRQIGKALCARRRTETTPSHPDCSGGRQWNAQRRSCVCPANRPVWNGKVCSPRAAPVRCPSGWTLTNRDRAKALVRQGWEIRQIGKALCARRRAQQSIPETRVPTQPSCTGGQRYDARRKKCVCPTNQTWNQRARRCVPRQQLQQIKPQQTPQIQRPQIQTLPQLKKIVPQTIR